MDARHVIAKTTNPGWTTPGPTLEHIYRNADAIISALREHPEVVRSLLSVELLADLRWCAALARTYGMRTGRPERVLAWLGEQ